MLLIGDNAHAFPKQRDYIQADTVSSQMVILVVICDYMYMYSAALVLQVGLLHIFPEIEEKMVILGLKLQAIDNFVTFCLNLWFNGIF